MLVSTCKVVGLTSLGILIDAETYLRHRDMFGNLGHTLKVALHIDLTIVKFVIQLRRQVGTVVFAFYFYRRFISCTYEIIRYYRRIEVWGKAMFLHVSVHRREVCLQGEGVCLQKGRAFGRPPTNQKSGWYVSYSNAFFLECKVSKLNVFALLQKHILYN